MQLKVSKKLISTTLLIVIAVVAIVLFGKGPTNESKQEFTDSNLPTIVVKAGYNPTVLELPAEKSNTVRFVTKNTYDCSASLLISKFNVEKFLPPNGNTDIVIPPQPKGSEVVAGCSMGMYSFKLKFI